MTAAMTDFEPSLRPLEPAPLTPLRERQRRGNERPFDLGRRRDDEPSDPEPEPTPPASDALDAPVAPRAEDEAGGHLDVTA